MASLLAGVKEELAGSDSLDNGNSVQWRDLVFASHGFFAMLAEFRTFSTDPGLAMAVEFKSGYLLRTL